MTATLPPCAEAPQWIALVRIPFASMTVLRDRQADWRSQGPIAVSTCVKFAPVEDMKYAFGVRGRRRIADGDIILAWWATGRRRPQPRTSYVKADRYCVLEMGNVVVLAQAFHSEADARAWAQARRTAAFPEWET